MKKWKRYVVMLLTAALLGTVALFGGASVLASETAPPESVFDPNTEVTVAELGVVGSQGMLFGVKKAGRISAVKRYVADPGIHKVTLWECDAEGSADRAVLLAGPFDWTVADGKAGWQSFSLPNEVTVTPGKYYVVCVSTSTSAEGSPQFSAMQGFFQNRNAGGSNILTYANSSRQWNAGDGTLFPQGGNEMWDFCIDIVYRENVRSGPKVSMVDPSLPPEIAAEGVPAAWNYGVEFQVKKAGSVSKLRAYFQKGASGTAYACLWNKDTGEKVIDEITWNLGTVAENGWLEYSLAAPVPVQPGTNYVVSVSASSTGVGVKDLLYYDGLLAADYETSGYNRELFQTLRGVFSQDVHAMPDTPSPNAEGGRYFFRDVVFDVSTESNPPSGDLAWEMTLVLAILAITASVATVRRRRTAD